MMFELILVSVIVLILLIVVAFACLYVFLELRRLLKEIIEYKEFVDELKREKDAQERRKAEAFERIKKSLDEKSK